MPASYPGAVKTFTTKVDGTGNKIFAAHINDLQDEVHAIEDGILNGTAPVTSSNMTAASLVVTGTSTLAAVTAGASTLASLQVSGGSTFAGAVVMPPPDSVRLELAASLAVANNSTTAVAWTTRIYATNSSMHSTASNPSQVTFQSTGLFDCAATISWNACNSTNYIIKVEDSSGGVVGFGSMANSGSTSVGAGLTIVARGLKYVDALAGSPWVRVVVRAIGSTNSLDNTAGQTSFTVTQLR